MEDILQQIANDIVTINPYEAIGLIFGLLAVIFLIRENIWTWPAGIIYVLASLVIFWTEKLYADFALHIFFLGLNIYGWWYWLRGTGKTGSSGAEKKVPVTNTSRTLLTQLCLLSTVGIFIMGFFLSQYTDASLPYWDSTTTVLSAVAIWLTARKKIENWHFWFVVDVLATGIYFYKDIYFYAILYLIYIGLAVSGYLEWKKTMQAQATA